MYLKKFTAAVLFMGLPLVAMAVPDEEKNEESLVKELEEIVVSARQPATRLEGTTLVTNVVGSELENIGNAFDLLAQLPMVVVEDDAVSVSGKGDVEIFIDGRPMRDEAELRQLLSSDIRKVELLMAPGASYGSTTGAVLRISTRRRFTKGISLAVTLEGKRRRRWSEGVLADMSYRIGNDWEIFFSGIADRTESLVKGTTFNYLDYKGMPVTVGSSQHSARTERSGTVKAGFNYHRSGQSVGAYYRFAPERATLLNNGTEWVDDTPPVVGDISSEDKGRSHLVSLYYDGDFGNGRRLHFDGIFRRATSENNVGMSYPDDESLVPVNSVSDRSSTLWGGKLYMEHPMFGGSLTAGGEGTKTASSLDYMMLNQDVSSYIPSSISDSRQTSFSTFASWKRMFDRLSVSVGARYEYVDYVFEVNSVRDKYVSRRSHTVTPDISLGWIFDGRSQITLSYKSATVRPPYAQLTGALNYVGLHQIEGGNPALADERMHSVQMFGMWDSFMLQAAFTRSDDTYAFVKRLYPAPSLQLMMQPVNVDVSSLDVYLVWERRVRAWRPSLELGLYQQWMRLGGDAFNKPIFSYSFANTFTLPWNLLLTANFRGQSCGDMHTNRFAASWFTASASLGRDFLKDGALQIRLSATDIFNTACNDWSMHTFGVFMDKRQSYDRRGVALSLTYRFQPRKVKYMGGSAAEAEERRL